MIQYQVKKVNSVTTDEGTYEIDENTGKVNFTPAPGFIGTAKPLTVSANVTLTGDDGQPVVVESSTTYTPTVTPVTPTAEPKETTDIQGKEQTGKPTFTPGLMKYQWMMILQRHSRMVQKKKLFQVKEHTQLHQMEQ